ALGDLADDLVAMHRLLGEERKHRRADVAAGHTWPGLLLEHAAKLIQGVPQPWSGAALTPSARRIGEAAAHVRTVHDVLPEPGDRPISTIYQRYIVRLPCG